MLLSSVTPKDVAAAAFGCRKDVAAAAFGCRKES